MTKFSVWRTCGTTAEMRKNKNMKNSDLKCSVLLYANTHLGKTRECEGTVRK